VEYEQSADFVGGIAESSTMPRDTGNPVGHSRISQDTLYKVGFV